MLGAISLVSIVLRMKPSCNNRINKLATYVFPIYITQGALIDVMPLLYKNDYEGYLMLIVWVNAVMIIFTSFILEFFRRVLFEGIFETVVRFQMYLKFRLTQKITNKPT